jgi:glutathione S-transferase
VPYLVADGQLIHGSADIIDWADNATPSKNRLLTPDAGREECLRIEKRIDDIAGVHIRRFFYSEALVEFPNTVRPMFTRDLPLPKKRLDLGTEQGQESRDITEGELDWLDELLSDGRKYLAGDEFSRADIAAASLLAPLALPPEHPTYDKVELPPKMAASVSGWEQRPSIRWVRDIYAQYR